jgi:hypothetical protein
LSQLLGYLAVKNDLKEEVSQFLFDLFRVILIKRLKKFIGFLNKKGPEASSKGIQEYIKFNLFEIKYI